jgi:hypothetical protein
MRLCTVSIALIKEMSMKFRFIRKWECRNVPAMAGDNSSIVNTFYTVLLLLGLLMIPNIATSADVSTGLARDSQQDKMAVSDKCKELTSRMDIDLKEVVRAGCQPSQAQLSKMMDNPVGSLVFVANQFYWTQLEGPRTNGAIDAYAYKLIPTFPIPIGKSWNLINRPVFSVVSVPLKKEVGNLIGMSETEIIQQPSLFSTIRDPFGRTTGFGDISYVGLLSPKTPDKIGTGIFVWGLGPTFIFPTASETILGQGKYQAGPAGVAAYIGKDWAFGLFPQQWWSYAGDGDRSRTNMTNIQYFIYYNITDTIKVGMGPNASINWTANSSDMVTLPVGLGINWMTKVGKLPIRFGIEGYYSVIHPQDTMGSRFSVKFTMTPVIPTFLLF